MDCDIRRYLPLVRKPSRYIDHEVNSVRKDPAKVRLRFGLGFPDAYEVGMSHLGIQILYHVLNGREEIACERVFAPWTDMEALLREKGASLTTLETSVPLRELDIMGFSLQYELSYTNVLNMLDLGSIPLLARERGKDDPFVIGGGPSAFNPEPVADFFDAFLLGDGEEAVLEIADAVMEGRSSGEERGAVLRRLARIKGVYVPSFFEVSYNADGTVREAAPLVEGYDGVEKRVLLDLDTAPYPIAPLVPFTGTVHDRISIEIARGCTRGCRFCQAGMIYRPARERKPSTIVRMIREAVSNTGYDEASLLSLSTGDYTQIEELLSGLMHDFVKERVAISLPSLRVGTLSGSLASEIKKVRKTGFTLAPEAGSARLRTLINKGITEEDLLKAAGEVFTLGWNTLKLYFMTGLPTETAEDVLEIVRLAREVKKAGKDARGGRAPQINVSVASFIPKPFTPFQWEPQVTMEEGSEKQRLLRAELGRYNLTFKWHDPAMSLMEGVFSRGDRRLSGAVRRAFEAGARFDGWSEMFNLDIWMDALQKEGLDPAFYTSRRRPFDEVLPWDHLDSGVTKEFLLKEYENSLKLAETPDCKVGRCTVCGVCDHRVVRNVVAGEYDAETGGPAGRPEEGPRAAEGPPARMRVRFSKTGDLRFLSHLELVDALKRLIRRAGLGVRYSEGFHPMPRLAFSDPLPVGMESMDEYVDIDLEPALNNGLSPEGVLERLRAESPEGLDFHGASLISLKVPSGSAMIRAEEYLINLKDGPLGLKIDFQGIDGILRDFLSRESVVLNVKRKDKVKQLDIRPLVRDLRLLDGGRLSLVLNKGDGAGVRPVDVVSCLFGLSREDSSLIPILKTRVVC